MYRIAFKMQLFKNCEAEYRKRHNALWPELRDLLKDARVSNYSIFFDAATDCVFAVLQAADKQKLKNLSTHPLMQKWWDHLVDIMETNPDNSPVQVPLTEIFYLE
ncbi:L-rhamnose mutarotase [Pedobacter sp. BS3]|uniref:L-rhamnose mutarotase n=1 Tax=Pedobacter sp. BS3 TaxID=2567937 RepID=UPI0011EBB08E|nr:L-rhamnose mutarotase [Pedobacter sp. BS3]TZF82813.1 L-rhamnose mutarotase [Pedobacter sp. BS3]